MAVEAAPEVTTRRFTADEVWQMVDAGIIRPDERLELIEGELCVVTPADWDHASVVEEVGRALGLAYGLEDFIVRMQTTVAGGNWYLPEPDVCVRPHRGPWTAERRHPRIEEFLLIVEVSATSPALDRRKARLYAEAGAPVYWIIDIPSRTATVHEGAKPDGTWDRVSQFGERAALALPGSDAVLALRDVLPRPE